MIFWVWARHLEDVFDGKTRMNLRHLIGQARRRPASLTEDGEVYYYLRDHASPAGEKDDRSVEGDKGKELSRIDSCAVFHKITSGKGVPHTFTGRLLYGKGRFVCQ
jgi:KUP system potassium uptake protein